ncbi:MAG: type II toxin-antitoxin system RatA family toxin [Alphaproteobacteria bacterium]
MTTHTERRHVPYTPEQMFELVAAVDAYPEFLPWCTAARIRRRSEHLIVADLAIGYKAVREKFTSEVHLHRPSRIDITYSDGPFKYLNSRWQFERGPGGTRIIDFHVDFEFRSRLLQRIIGLFFHEAVRRMVRAFETRAARLYGDGAGTAEPSVEGPAA